MHPLATVRSVLSACLLAMLAACATVSAAAGNDSARSVEDGQDFSMQVGDRVTLADHATLRYIGISNDSRCLPDVQCIWAGDAEVRFEWSMAGASKAFSLHTGKDPRRQALGDRSLTLVSLARGDAPEARLRIERSP
jgi:hypothetical protein